MNDAQFNDQRRRLRRVVKAWIDSLGLGGWLLHLSYDRTGEAFNDEVIDNGHIRLVNDAKTTVKWEYQEASISFNVPEFVDYDDDRLEFIVVHELCHLLVNEMRSDHEGERAHGKLLHEERVCTQLARAFIATRDRARAEARRA